MRRYSLWQGSYLSFFSRDFYRDVGFNWRGLGFLHLLMVLAVCWGLTVLDWHSSVKAFVEDEAGRVVRQIPPITITNGVVSADVPQPHYIREPQSGEVIAVIDTTGELTSLDETDAHMLLTRDELHYRDDHETRIEDLSEVQSFHIDQQIASVWIDRLATWGLVAIFPFLIIGSYVARLIQALIYAVIGLIIANVMGFEINFDRILNLAVVAVTPAIIVKTLLGLVGITLPLAGLLLFAVAIGYLTFAMKSVAEAEPSAHDQGLPIDRRAA